LTPAHKAEGSLVLVTMAWGLTFPLIKGALDHSAPFALMALRFPLALFILWPLLKWRVPARSSLAPGLVLAFLLGSSYLAQVVGLTYTTPTRSAFITGLSVILVPLLYPFFTRKAPGKWPMAGVGIALVGLFLLTNPGGGGFNHGDWITLITALGYALYVIVLEVSTKKHPYEDLLVVQFALLAVVFAPVALYESQPIDWGSKLVWALAFTGPILALTVYLQNRYQQFTTATRAAVIFTGEPVFAAVFSYVIVGETLSEVQWMGGAVILLGILTAVRR
jgi:drug/metabolite transporter (DMT)-like permease